MGYSERPERGQWGAQTFLSASVPGYWMHDGLLGVHTSGATCLEWEAIEFAGPGTGTSRMVERAVGGSWSVPGAIPTVLPGGIVTAGRNGCRDRLGIAGTTLRVAQRASGVGWRPVADMPRAHQVVAVNAALTGDSQTTTAVWVELWDAQHVVHTSARTASGAWQSPTPLSSGDVDPRSV